MSPVPSIPHIVEAVAVASDRILLLWQPSNVPGALPWPFGGVDVVTSYAVSRGASAKGPFRVVAYVHATPLGTQEYVDHGLDPDTTYFYELAAVDDAGSSAPSNVVSARTAIAPPPYVTASQSGIDEIDVEWSLSPGGNYSYSILRAKAADGLFAHVADVAVAAPYGQYRDQGLDAGTTYFYVITASHGGRTSAQSSPPASAMTAIAIPTGLTVIAVSPNEIDVHWQPSVGAGGYAVVRDGVPLTTVAAPTVSFDDASLTPGSRHCYRIWTLPTASGFTNELCATTPSVATPTNVSAMANPSGSITVSWSAAAGAASYTVLRSMNPMAPFTVVATGVNALSFDDVGLTSGTTFYYEVQAADAAGHLSAPSMPPASATTKPSSPTGVTAVKSSPSSILISWMMVPGAVFYNVYRASSAAGQFNTVGSAMGASFTDTGVMPGATAVYKVTAVNSGGESAFGFPIPSVTLPPAAPTLLQVVPDPQDGTKLQLKWTASFGASTYTITHANPTAQGTAGSFAPLATTPNAVTTFSVAPPVAGPGQINNISFWQVIANDAGGSSAPSNTFLYTVSINP